MARGTLAPIELGGSYPTDGTLITWTTGNASDNHNYRSTEREILKMKNSGVTSRTVTIKSVANRYGRGAANATPLVITLTSGQEKAVYLPADGYRIKATGMIEIDVSHAEVLLAVLRLPTAIGN